MKRFSKYLLVLMLFVSYGSVYAQGAEQQARRELERRGLGDEEVRQRLEARGIDINSIDINNPAEVFRVEKELKDVVKELEAEKLKNEAAGIDTSGNDNKAELTDEQAKAIAKEGETISKSIEDGATLQEAVSEELIEGQEGALPNATVYGQEIFRTQSLKLYRQSEDVKPPETYILGVGDKLAIAIWGYSEDNLVFEINNEGYIKPTGSPRIYLKGLRFGEAKKLLEDRFSRFYRFRPQEFQVTLNFARTINVNIVGEVFNYGSFNIPAINTAFNALVAAGGPNDVGSVRNIKFLRAGESPKTIDIYEYLMNPAYGQNLYLEENDIIHVPVAEKIVQIKGAIIRPQKYELLKSENLVDLLQYCGGFKANATLQNVQIKRFQNDKEVILDVNFNQLMKLNDDFNLLNGDVVTVYTIPEDFKNFVKIEGAVDIPGTYSIESGTRVSELLSRVNLLDNALTELAYIKRLNLDGKTFSYQPINIELALRDRNSSANLILENKDQIIIYERAKFVDDQYFKISGEVREPSTFAIDQSKNLKISDAVIFGGGLKEDATDFAYLRRKDEDNLLHKKSVRIDLREIIQNPNSDLNLELEAGDEIVVYSKLDFLDSQKILVRGAVRNEGEFEFNKSISIKDLLTMAGGLKYNASKTKIDVYRLTFEDDNNTKTIAATLKVDENYEIVGSKFELKPFDQIVIRYAPEFEEIANIYVNGEIRYPGIYAIIKENETIASLIERAGGLTDEAFEEGAQLIRSSGIIGNISFDLKEALNNNKSDQNLILKKGDRIIVPKIQEIVSVIGATNARSIYSTEILADGAINTPFESGKNAMHYINKYCGGLAPQADKSSIYVKFPNGELRKTKRFLFFYKYPEVRKGSTIRVGYDLDEINPQENKETDWGQIFQDSIGQVTAVLTLLLLVQRLD